MHHTLSEYVSWSHLVTYTDQPNTMKMMMTTHQHVRATGKMNGSGAPRDMDDAGYLAAGYCTSIAYILSVRRPRLRHISCFQVNDDLISSSHLAKSIVYLYLLAQTCPAACRLRLACLDRHLLRMSSHLLPISGLCVLPACPSVFLCLSSPRLAGAGALASLLCGPTPRRFSGKNESVCKSLLLRQQHSFIHRPRKPVTQVISTQVRKKFPHTNKTNDGATCTRRDRKQLI